MMGIGSITNNVMNMTSITLLHPNIGTEVHKAKAYHVTRSSAVVPTCRPYLSRRRPRSQYYKTNHDDLVTERAVPLVHSKV